MVFHCLLALHKLQYQRAPNVSPPITDHPYMPNPLTVGIGCGPAGNNCSVEGHGGHGPGPMPGPKKDRGIFPYSTRVHNGDGSLFDLSRARSALSSSRANGGVASSSRGNGGIQNGIMVLPAASHGFGSSAYNSTPSPLYSLSHVAHAGHFTREVGPQNTNTFYGGVSRPTAVDVTSSWGRSVQGSQFSSASLVPQTHHTSFNFKLHDGVINMASVSVASDAIFRPSSDSASASHRIGYSWDPKRSQANSEVYYRKGFLAPAPSTQAPADGPAGYSSI